MIREGLPPETLYARTADGRRIAHQVLGDVPRGTPIVSVTNWVSNVEVMWEERRFQRFFRRLPSAGSLIVFDKLGTGVSDPLPSLDMAIGVSVEQGAAGLLVTLDARGVERAALLGADLGSWVATFFAATWPERTASLVLEGSCARFTRSADHPYGVDAGEEFDGCSSSSARCTDAASMSSSCRLPRRTTSSSRGWADTSGSQRRTR